MAPRSFREFFESWKEQLESMIVQHGGRRCLRNVVWTPGERPYLPATPEEVVRQGFASYLCQLGIAKERVKIEKALRTCGRDPIESRRRFDLVVHGQDGPILLVEFKRESDCQSLIQLAYHQGRTYALALKCPYLLLCKGSDSRLFEIAGGALRQLYDREVPSELLSLGDLSVSPKPKPPTFTEDYFHTARSLEQPWAIPYLVALQNFIVHESLVDSSHVRVTQDFSTDWGCFGNAGGSHTKGVQGFFHFYEIERDDGDRSILGVAIAKYDDPAPGYHAKNIFTVGLDRKSCLEMATSARFIRREADKIVLWHNGQLGAAGATREDGLAEFSRRLPRLYDRIGKRVVFYRDDQAPGNIDWRSVVGEILAYALERESVEAMFRVRRSPGGGRRPS